jgi:quercetin dioxygenase-like cupin family protein
MRVIRAFCASAWLLLVLATASEAFGQASMRPCPPVSERNGVPGPACFIAKEELGKLPEQPIYWHLDRYPTQAGAEAARGRRGVVVESFGKIWLFTIAEKPWRAPGGEHVANVGPLPVQGKTSYTAVYLESTFAPGMTAPIHLHSGPEAFYTLTGDTCLETPDGAQVARGPGHVEIVPGGPPMFLMAIGTQRRQGLALILHDSSRPATTMVNDWKPKGLCNAYTADAPNAAR